MTTFKYLSDAYNSLGPAGGTIWCNKQGLWEVTDQPLGKIVIDTTGDGPAGLVGDTLRLTHNTEVITRPPHEFKIGRVFEEYQ